ncbi:hypothetical protein SPRG_17272 [Saprolegnia parasitica CBS 223.65]|uniref:HIT domain-containing protein n=1 Tax=Saprolegnia parasitica (strain CBS 223.65) TaxID=695850 RepID=A0A067BFY4_SAPPC|nr:hypothetical protein SPRG_17272 [Saprolegnia parasitica CBS 223.65]KDO17294.1 hypothetical protein SPRG_17272 [Saprolegnia parasitica CBS 223.65]|eukprot:XP_012211997.1 hypothetical protein SPRG_17272 [Saprolegnia parasitica CBS 223.65]
MYLWKRTFGRPSHPQPCVFCDRTQIQTSGILFEDDRVMAFRDRKPRAASHLLVIPKEHIVNTHALGHGHIDLVEHMVAVGRAVLAKEASVLMLPELPGVFGFHQYPFTSVDHLHLHCLAPPFEPCYNRLRYRETWFANYVSVETLLASLKDGRHH